MENIMCFDSDGNSICNLVQWDKDQVIYIDNFFNDVVPEAHFALQTDKNNSYKYPEATSLANNKIKIIIPNEMLLASTKLYIFLYYHLSSSYTTKFVITLPIKHKPKPQDYKYEENLNGVSLETVIEEIGNTVFNRVNTDLTEQINTATAQIQDITLGKLGDINNTAIAQINAINNTAIAQAENLSNVTNSKISDINLVGTEHINNINALAPKKINEINTVTIQQLDQINTTAQAQINAINTTAQAQARSLESQGNKLLEQIGYIPASLQIATGTLSDMIDVENFDSIIIGEVVIDGWHLGIEVNGLYIEKYVDNIQTDRIFIKNENTTLDISDCDGIKFETSYQGGAGYESTINYFGVKYDIKKTLSNLNNDVDHISNFSASGIICSSSGESIYISDASDKRLVSHKVFGNSTQLTTTGAQLMNIYKDEHFHRYAFEIKDLNISDSSIFTFPYGSTEKVTTANTRFLIYKLPVEEGKIYTIAGTNEGMSVQVMLSIYPKNAQNVNDREQILVTLKNTSYTFTAEDKDYMLEFRTPQASEGEISTDKTTITLMLNEGTTALPWEPYTGGNASPSPDYPQTIKSVGNGGSIEETVTTNLATIHTTGNNCNIGYVKKGVTYTFCFEQDTETGFNLWVNGNEESKIGSITVYRPGTKVKVQYTPQIDGKLYINGFSSVNQRNFMLVIGEHLDFIDFVEPKTQKLTLSTSDGLNGIPVSSDGNYTDENGQQWVCDTIERYSDGTGKRIQRIGIVDNNDWKISNVLDGTQGERYKISCDIKRIMPVLCTHYGYKKNVSSYSNEGDYISNEESGTICIRCSGRLFESTEAFVEMAKSENMKTCYILNTPIETPLTTEELAEFEKFHTYKPTTNITTDCDAGIEIEYVADTKTYIDNKFNELATSMMSQNK